jgi:IS66 C-terminal element
LAPDTVGLDPETYLKDIRAKIAEGHTIKRIEELVPWRMIPAAATSSP